MRSRDCYTAFGLLASVVLITSNVCSCASEPDHGSGRTSLAASQGADAIAGYRAEILAGFLVYVSNDLSNHQRELETTALSVLEDDLRQITAALPDNALRIVHNTPIFIELESEPRESGFSGRGAVYHVSRDWLVAHDFIPEKTGAIEIANVRDYLNWRGHQPSMILHEFAHAYYWKIGPELPSLQNAYGYAVDSGIYENVRYILAADPDDLRRAYALNNEQEYFAELSEAYFGRNDYFPFIREDLRKFDPIGYSMIEDLWGISP